MGPGFSDDEMQKIVEILRIRGIIMTDIKSQATVIIVQNDIQNKQQNIDEIISQKFHIPERLPGILPEIIISERQRKKTFDNNHAIKQFYATKQNYKQRFLTRTKCK